MKFFYNKFSFKKIRFLLTYYYPVIFFYKLKNGFIKFKNYTYLTLLKKFDEYIIQAFLNEAQRIYPKINLKKIKNMDIKVDLSYYSLESEKAQTGNFKKRNPFRNFKIGTEHHYVESEKIRMLQERIIKWVFEHFFLIELNKNESLTLSYYSDASIVCGLFLKFNNLSTKVYFEQEDYDKFHFFYKHFIEIVKIRLALKDYQSEIPEIFLKLSPHYLKLVYFLTRKGIKWGYLLNIKDILLSEFPNINLQRFELEQLKYKLKKFKKDIQRKNSTIEQNKEIISNDIYIQILTELGIQNEKVLKELEFRDLDFNEDKYSELDSLFDKYRNLIRDIHSNQITIFLLVNIYFKTSWRQKWLVKTTK